VTRDTLCPRP